MAEPRDFQGAERFESCLELIKSLIAYAAFRHRMRSGDAEDFCSHVMLKLIENDYARLRKYRGSSSLKTYLTVVIQRLYLDYCADKHGRWRPSTRAKALGEMAVAIEALLYRDGHTFDEVERIVNVSRRQGVPRDRLWELATALPFRAPRRFVGEEELERLVPNCRDASRSLDGEDEPLRLKLLAALRRSISEIPPQDALVLRMRFEGDLKAPQIAAALRMAPRAVYHSLAKSLRALRKLLETEGLLKEDALHVAHSQKAELELSWDRLGSP